MRRGEWTPEEDEILRREYPTGGWPAAQRALADAGFQRSALGIQKRARRLEVYYLLPDRGGVVVPFAPIDPVDGVVHTRGRYPASVGRALWRLAESNPTPERFEREKARILQERV